MTWNVGAKIGAAFSLTLLVFVIVGAVSYRSTTQLIAAGESRRLTYEVLGRLTEMLSLLQDVQLGQRGYALVGEEVYLEPYRAAVDKIGPAIQAVRTLTADNPIQQRHLDALEPVVRNRLAYDKESIELRRDKGAEASLQLVKTSRGRLLMDDIRRIVDEMRGEEERFLQQRVQTAQNDADAAQRTIVLGTLTALVLAALAGLQLTRNIARPLQELTAVAERITVGDLRVNVSTSPRSDEVGVLARAFDRMTQSLRAMAAAAEQIAAGDLRSAITPQSPDDLLGSAFSRMIGNLRGQTHQLVEGANVLSAAAGEIVTSTTQLASSASQSAAAVSETTTTVEEVRQTAQVSSQKARNVLDSAQKAAQISMTGRKSTEDVRAGMARIRQEMDAIAASMGRLSEQSQAIGQIIATVDDLSAQSNLLAVNAAIEAAKAGEHGKGFGVVAHEVKSLAAQSRQATNEVRTILNDIQKATTTAVMATEQGSKAVEAGVRQTEAAGESIQALGGSVSEAAQAATQIAASSQQQLVGIDQVAAAMENIKQASAQNVAGAGQLDTAARNIRDLGERLKQIVERYRV